MYRGSSDGIIGDSPNLDFRNFIGKPRRELLQDVFKAVAIDKVGVCDVPVVFKNVGKFHRSLMASRLSLRSRVRSLGHVFTSLQILEREFADVAGHEIATWQLDRHAIKVGARGRERDVPGRMQCAIPARLEADCDQVAIAHDVSHIIRAR